MRKLWISILSLLLPCLIGAQCTTVTQDFADATLQDSNQHSSLGHSAATGIFDVGNPGGRVQPGTDVVGTCTYTDPGGGATTCNTSCSVALAGSTSTSERGNLNSTGTHEVFKNWVSGQSSAVGGGASCTGAFGGGTANCGIGGCQASIGLSITINGQSASATLSGLAGASQVWANASPFPFSCAARSVSTTAGSGGGPPPDPCLNSATAQGPTGNFGPGDPGGGGPSPECSPIIIDTDGKGFHLTSADGGVAFDIAGTGHPVQIAWTAPGWGNAFLALPGPDGLVRNGKQLFGNFTPQPSSPNPNGFLALAEYDKPENGGNADGVIDEKDAVFSRLRLWIDENHDGICQPTELHTLPELGIYSLALSYFESRRKDDFGNQFRYKARVNPDRRRDPRDETQSGDPGRWAYDVFFVSK